MLSISLQPLAILLVCGYVCVFVCFTEIWFPFVHIGRRLSTGFVSIHSIIVFFFPSLPIIITARRDFAFFLFLHIVFSLYLSYHTRQIEQTTWTAYNADWLIIVW